jgi:hypothetical protein
MQFSPDTLGYDLRSSTVLGAIPAQSRASVDPFGALPNEILHAICQYMPGKDLRAFLTASSMAYFAALDQRFWRTLCTSLVPWAWEFWDDMYHHHTPSTDVEMNYRKLYLLLEENTRNGYGMAPSLSGWLGMANRRRIWDACMQLLPHYQQALTGREAAGGVSKCLSELAEGCTARPHVLVTRRPQLSIPDLRPLRTHFLHS